ncbi:unnamed protein product [Leptosia nina]|uniref:Condensin II complex subunit H2 N-terminal domain-containing protein n=1 Tax=Leptosia nina TaxID=320188 RepID=A0AAV1IXV6_9NEOP
MEADEDRNLSRRKKRWSMNSQRLDAIVAQLIKPIKDLGQNFDTGVSALLEDYLTEAGLRALDAEESTEVEPNFAEIAMILQHLANIYSRKVDYLYQDVLRITDSLNNTLSIEETEQGQTVGSKRKATGPIGFDLIELQTASSANREPVPRVPPTLPRMYIELEPRQIADGDAQLLDRTGEPIGLLADFHVAWRLQGGYLVEELEQNSCKGGLRPLQDLELSSPPQSPCAVPDAPEPAPPLTMPQLNTPQLPPSPLLPLSPFNCSTPKAQKCERKRRREVNQESNQVVKLLISEEMLAALRAQEEFSLPESWIRRVIDRRSGQVLAARIPLRSFKETEFRGWDSVAEAGGFCGWPAEEAQTALTALRRIRARADESDDDGFFEQSSYSDGEPRQSPAHLQPSLSTAVEESDWQSWQERVLSRIVEKTPDVQQTAAQLLNALGRTQNSTHVNVLLRHQHQKHGTHPAHLTLAALFLANSGNIEIIQGEPLTVNSFSVKLLSTDESHYRPAIAKDHLS